MEIGLGQLHLAPDEFWTMTPYEFLCAQKGFFDLYKTQERSNWHRTIQLINVQLPKKDRIDPEKVFRERKPAPKLTMEERKRQVEKFLKIKIDGPREPEH